MADEQFYLIACPDCGLMMSRTETVAVDEHWSEFRCWDCGHVFGGQTDRGALDLGLIRQDDSHLGAQNNYAMFLEEWMGVQRLEHLTDDPTG